MKIHKEGYKTLAIILFVLIIINVLVFIFLCPCSFAREISLTASSLVFLFFLQFFRSPNRTVNYTEGQILSPADGKVVVIEKTTENEYLKDERIMISVFMSTWNVHINWFPVNGEVTYYKYHAGKFLLAINPKSSLENERTTVAVKTISGTEILFRQIAGIVARRIISNTAQNSPAKAGKEFGFIKFGSRVDIFLPLDAKINVKIGDKVKGTQTILAEL
jgi:phosphatidylserine decarboxylase